MEASSHCHLDFKAQLATWHQFAYMRKATTNVDVFSFGVVVMEFLMGRRPTGLEEENGLPITLPQLVQKSLENGIGSVLQIIDPLLASNVSKNEGVVEDLLKLAFSCTCLVPKDRPDMDQVLSSLSKITKWDQIKTAIQMPIGTRPIKPGLGE
ncbi:hypothetical protein LguiA_025065 [Lonicera macranthoides]